LSQPFDLRAYLAAEKKPVEAALERAISWIARCVPAEVAEAARHGVLSDGKRLRPILCVATHRACGGPDGDAAYDLAASLELIHAYSLMHDDLPCMDDADLRRGRPTTHREHGEAVTLRAGAALIPAAALQAWRAAKALGCDDDAAAATVTVLLQASGGGGMVGGQWIDLEGEGESLAPEDLDDLHRRKTGALLTGSLLLGARAAGAGERVREALQRYGRAVGLAFQIADDILDATQSAETLGKNPSDAALDKSTYVAVHGLEEARGRGDREVDRALTALRDSGLEAPALAALARYVMERRH
jgi:geranylgeranyl pyrophosphate synthase